MPLSKELKYFGNRKKKYGTTIKKQNYSIQKNKVAIITGGSSGIGRATVAFLSKRSKKLLL
jgi:ABC-type lipoprotein export system ATPase subunit